MTNLSLLHTSPKKVDLQVLALFEDNGKSALLIKDDALSATVDHLIKQGAFKPGHGATYSLHPSMEKRVLLLGLGEKKPKKKSPLSVSEQLRRLGGKLFRALKAQGNISAVLDIDTLAEGLGQSPQKAAQHLAEGILLANYNFVEHKGASSKEKKKSTLSLALTGKGSAAGIKEAKTLAEFVLSCRDLQATPPNIADPAYLSSLAKKGAKGLSNLKVTIYGESDLKKKKAVGILAVGAGSAKESQMIVMDYNPPGAQGTLGLVGKAVTFDTGGISLKPGAKMHEMKYDKSGGCAVINFMHLVATLGLKHRVVGIITAAENMPSSTATRPGDIITYRNGTSVEILNTDAEGRLVLADGLIEIGSFKPDVVIDLATLTGMCVATFGHVAAGLLSNQQGLADALLSSGQESGERLWQLPLWDEYSEMIKGEHADIKNIGGPNGGTITAAWFLKHFVPEGTPWAHLDIAGTAWGDFKNPYVPNGPSGFGVRLLLDFLQANGKHLGRFKKEATEA